MTCPHALEIKRKLLLPPCRTFLQKYIDRWKIDPRFLVYFRESTNLAIRQELGCSMLRPGVRNGCQHRRLADCCMADCLKEAMEERIYEQEIEEFDPM